MAAKTVLIYAHGVLPTGPWPATGNGVRALVLAQGLRAHGYEVELCTDAEFMGALPLEQSSEPITLCEGERSFAELVLAKSPDVLVLEQGERLHTLDRATRSLVVADLFAPRLLEMQYEGAELGWASRRLLTWLTRADLVLASSERGKAHLLSWLIMAGIDCRRAPLEVVPMGALGEGKRSGRAPAGTAPHLVCGGVRWPWVRGDEQLSRLAGFLSAREQGTLHVVSAPPPGGGDGIPAALGGKRVKHHDVLPYEALLKFYARCDFAVHLHPKTPERELSTPFRVMDYLGAGLPVLVNDYLEIAPSIAKHGAGWVVPAGDPDALEATLAELLSDTKQIKARQKGVKALLAEFSPASVVAPLAGFVAQGQRRPDTLQVAPPLGSLDDGELRIQRLEREIEGLQHVTLAQQKHSDALEERSGNLAQTDDSLAAECRKLWRSFDEYRERNEQMVRRLQDDLTGRQKLFEELAAQVTRDRLEAGADPVRLAQSEARATLAEGRNEELNERSTRVENELRELKARNEQLEDGLRELKARNEQLENELRDAHGRFQELEARLAEESSARHRMQAEKEDAWRQLEQVREELGAEASRRARAEYEYSRISGELQAFWQSKSWRFARALGEARHRIEEKLIPGGNGST